MLSLLHNLHSPPLSVLLASGFWEYPILLSTAWTIWGWPKTMEREKHAPTRARRDTFLPSVMILDYQPSFHLIDFNLLSQAPNLSDLQTNSEICLSAWSPRRICIQKPRSISLLATKRLGSCFVYLKSLLLITACGSFQIFFFTTNIINMHNATITDGTNGQSSEKETCTNGESFWGWNIRQLRGCWLQFCLSTGTPQRPAWGIHEECSHPNTTRKNESISVKWRDLWMVWPMEDLSLEQLAKAFTTSQDLSNAWHDWCEGVSLVQEVSTDSQVSYRCSQSMIHRPSLTIDRTDRNQHRHVTDAWRPHTRLRNYLQASHALTFMFDRRWSGKQTDDSLIGRVMHELVC